MYRARNNPKLIVTARRYYAKDFPGGTEVQAPGVLRVPGEPCGFIDGKGRFDVPHRSLVVYEKNVAIAVMSDEDFTSQFELHTEDKKDITGDDSQEAIKILRAVATTDSPAAVQAMLLLRKLGL